MGKTWKALCAVGGGLCVGSVAYAMAMGYEITNTQLWVVGVQTFFEAPVIIAGRALSGEEQAPLFQCIVMMSVGLFALGLGLVVWAIGALRPSFKWRAKKDSTTALRMKETAASKPTTPSAVSEDFGDKDVASKAATVSTSSRIKAALRERTKRDAFERDVDSAEQIGWLTKAKDVLGSLKKTSRKAAEANDRPENAAAKALLEDRVLDDEDVHVKESMHLEEGARKMVLRQKSNRKKTARLQMQEESDGPAWMGSVKGILFSVVDGLSKLRSIRGKNESGQEVPRQVSTAVKTKAAQKSLHEDIKEWFASVQSNSMPQHELVQKAAHFAKLLGPDERDAFTEEHSIDGAFILRLIDSWSTRTDVGSDTNTDDTSDSRGDERQALRAAIRAVHMEKAGLSSIDEASIPAEFTRSVDADTLLQNDGDIEDDEGIHDDVSRPLAETYTNEDSTQDDSNQERVQASVVALAEEMWVFAKTMRACLAGQTEWPEHLLYEEDREEEIDRLDKEWGVISFTVSEEDFERIASEEGSEALDWVVKETSVLDGGFKAFMQGHIETILAQAGGEEPATEEAWSDDAIVETSFGTEPVAMDEEDEESQDEPQDATPSEEQVSEQTAEEEASPSIEQAAAEEVGAGVEADLPEEEFTVEVESEQEAVVEDTPLPAIVEPTIEEVPVPAQEAAPYVPKSLGLTDEEEIEQAEKSVVEWGGVLQDCGATTGAIMRFVYKKEGTSVRTLGHIHVAAIWKKTVGIRRVNVLFRTLPAGMWQADPLVPGRFINEQGDWVAVRDSMFESADFDNALLMIHLKGEGVYDFTAALPPSWGRTIWVVKDIPGKDEIVARMDEAS